MSLTQTLSVLFLFFVFLIAENKLLHQSANPISVHRSLSVFLFLQSHGISLNSQTSSITKHIINVSNSGSSTLVLNSTQIGETCSSNGECDAGLRCDKCDASGNTRSRCVRVQPLNPTSKVCRFLRFFVNYFSGVVIL